MKQDINQQKSSLETQEKFSTSMKNLSLFKVKMSSMISKVKEGARTWFQSPFMTKISEISPTAAMGPWTWEIKTKNERLVLWPRTPKPHEWMAWLRDHWSVSSSFRAPSCPFPIFNRGQTELRVRRQRSQSRSKLGAEQMLEIFQGSFHYGTGNHCISGRDD